MARLFFKTNLNSIFKTIAKVKNEPKKVTP